MNKRKPISERIVISNIGKGWARVKDSKGKLFTIRNYAYIFTESHYYVFDIDEEQISHTRPTNTVEVLTIVKCVGDCALVAKRLSLFTQPSNASTNCKITKEEVEETIRKALDTGSYHREGRSLVTLYWVVDTFLQRKKMNEKSKWTTLANANIKDYISVSSKKLMDEHIQFKPPYIEELKKDVEKSILQKIKDKIS